MPIFRLTRLARSRCGIRPTFHLEVLPAGSYNGDRSLRIRTAPRRSWRGRRSSFAYAETLTIKPYAVPSFRGEIVMTNPFFLAGATITIGSVTVPASSDIDGFRRSGAAHAPGAVDVVVNSTAGQ